MQPNARPIVLHKQRDMDACIERAREAVNEWESAWLSCSVIDVDCCPALDPSIEQTNGEWRAFRHSQGTLIWCYLPAGFVRMVENRIFDLDETLRHMDRHRESDMAQGVTTKAVDDLVTSLMSSLVGPATLQFGTATVPDSWLFKRHSGSALVKISLGGVALSVLVPFERLPSNPVAIKPAAVKSLTPLPIALSNTDLRVFAELGEVEISLGNFASLQVGDVINLSIAIDQPLTVFTGNRCPIGAAHLGQQNGFRALAMFKLPQK